ncbi:MAG: hypothetical protein HKP61_15985 [Dactylosporangium sp.]|nr:hypothetical protein [Dactylosporangium sp.]NNJ62406.1 hypothetical protein [Dactylosporangium sp.]
MTTRELAKVAGLGQTTVQNALVDLEAAGTARRTPGAANGKRRSADMWRPIVAGPDVTTEAITDHTDPATDPADVPAGQPDASDTPADTSDPTDNGDEAPVAPRQPDLKVLIMAGVLGNHSVGVSAHEAIAESGLAVNVADTILLAMEVVGAARRLPVADGGTELWVRGEGDLATVDPANAPTHVTCPTCGHTRPIRRATAGARRQTTRTGRPAPEINTDGSERLGKNALRGLVEAFMRDLGTGHDVAPGTVGRELRRSPGAVGNAMDKLEEARVLLVTNEAPRMFALSPNAPAPTVAVTALLGRPVITDDVPASDAPADDVPASDAPVA